MLLAAGKAQVTRIITALEKTRRGAGPAPDDLLETAWGFRDDVGRVRLRQGRMEDETVFAEDPVEMADRWIEQGAQRLHIVDLDGAKIGNISNLKTVKKI